MTEHETWALVAIVAFISYSLGAATKAKAAAATVDNSDPMGWIKNWSPV